MISHLYHFTCGDIRNVFRDGLGLDDAVARVVSDPRNKALTPEQREDVRKWCGDCWRRFHAILPKNGKAA